MATTVSTDPDVRLLKRVGATLILLMPASMGAVSLYSGVFEPLRQLWASFLLASLIVMAGLMCAGAWYGLSRTLRAARLRAQRAIEQRPRRVATGLLAAE